MKRLTIVSTLVACALALPASAALGAPDPLRSQQWGLDLVDADAAHATSTGIGAVIAIVDTGVQANHPDLVGRVLPGYDFVTNTPIDPNGDGHDGNGHGTNVAGIAAASADNGIGVDSVAPGAKILPVRVLDNEGSGDDRMVTEGINWAIDHGADVINLSLGGGVVSTVVPTQIDDAINRALRRGIVVVAAAGNDGIPLCEQTARSRALLCVGAVDRRRDHSSFSAFGLGVSLAAPGGSGAGGSYEDVLSTFKGSRYEAEAGTSQATPHVSGVAALLVSLGVRGQAAVSRILSTSTDLGLSGYDLVFGAGLVNARRAVAGLARNPDQAGAPPPIVPVFRPFVSVATRQSLRQARARGIQVRCHAARPGRCRVAVYLSGRRVASRAADVAAGATVVVNARLSAWARRALSRVKSARVTVRVADPGLDTKTASVLLR